MAGCKHGSLEFIGEQATDDGVNSYYTCRECGSTVVVLPSKKVYAIEGAPPSDIHGPAKKSAKI